ncbi:DUF167 domain-containing protein [Nitrogeniibacter aestuarii]|uniref:DUF167 domain-containing protein n=1 Tax=Nitrogeniibacter aestuarii TaxID=2815343 RepID=UPI001D12449D|nr:DUF167 domain-containing protein [Nitrogeniibacter aestuarii]
MQVSADEVVLRLHIQPGAKTSGFAGRHGDAMKLRLAAPPVDGKANKALLAYLADFCGLPKSRVELVSGHTSRAKRVRLSGLSVSGLERLKDLD